VQEHFLGINFMLNLKSQKWHNYWGINRTISARGPMSTPGTMNTKTLAMRMTGLSILPIFASFWIVLELEVYVN
jgi:hypothetical protein